MPASNSPLRIISSIRGRAPGPLSATEVLQYLELLADHRSVTDPDYQPWSDWTGDLERAPEIQVRSVALSALREWGKKPARIELESRMQSLADAAPIATLVQDYIDLLSLDQAIPPLLAHANPIVRQTALDLLLTQQWFIVEQHLPLLISPLVDANGEAAARLLEIVRRAPHVSGPSSDPTLFERAARAYEQAQTEAKALHLQILVVAAVFCERWTELAALLPSIDVEGHNALVQSLSSGSLAQLLAAGGASVRDQLKAAVFNRFRSARPAWRYFETPMVCVFAPDADALELALQELRVRASAGMDVAPFLAADSALTPRILEIAFASAKNTQVDALGLGAIFEASPEACARAVANDRSMSQAARLDWLAKLWRHLPDSRDAHRLMAELRTSLAALSRQPRDQ